MYGDGDDGGAGPVFHGQLRKLRGRGRVAQVYMWARWTLYITPWLMLIGWLAAPLLSATAEIHRSPALILPTVVLGLVQCAVYVPGVRRGLSHYVYGTPAPWRLIAVSGVLSAVSVVLVTMLATSLPMRASLYCTAMLFPVLPAGSLLALVLKKRWQAVVSVAASVVAVAGLALTGVPIKYALGLPPTFLFSSAFAALTCRSWAWILAAMRELDEAKGDQARLAVAEERLRFARDMHDVVGRNLSVIALKSELGVRLARKGRPEAADQMAEVQQLAQDSQREVRDVVRAYREADLQVELAGARAVLLAAGVECLMDQEGSAGVPQQVQSVLAWVVREGTTNVLRHANAASCWLTLRVTPDGAPGAGRTAAAARPGPAVVFSMENDGVLEDAARRGDGSGIAGLRERLAAFGGTLTVGPRPGGRFWLRAHVPLEKDELLGYGPETAADGLPAGAQGNGKAIG
ncbi:histidine kinase [Streptomyces chrestomyceticus JCM 4735]|uniref:Histidine kinase n=1 Tax=Streptomyces chrestomyceticus JCM 4735 TaxID=1306181 RepID=A0A7U9KXG0_9ACTN|nr:histidine kinase [Streptomyces chrestomyceticus]GCD36587.1 histidine kinase [Streptomyces chrestomyceticus JCM 4735]